MEYLTRETVAKYRGKYLRLKSKEGEISFVHIHNWDFYESTGEWVVPSWGRYYNGTDKTGVNAIFGCKEQILGEITKGQFELLIKVTKMEQTT